MQTLCFGGSFNPIHNGHLVCARAAAEAVGADRVLLIPSRQPPHKPLGLDLATPDDRLSMCRLAVEDDPFFTVSDIELHRDGPSFTIDTVRQLRASGMDEISWLIGADMLCILPTWHEASALLAEASFVILARPGWSLDWQTLPSAYQNLASKVVAAPHLEISATDIRRRLRAGLSVNYLTPPKVIDFIRERGLYR